MASAVVRACSVLQFQATRTLVPNWRSGTGGASSTGRPLSNSPDSSARTCSPIAFGSGRPIAITSNTRP